MNEEQKSEFGEQNNYETNSVDHVDMQESVEKEFEQELPRKKKFPIKVVCIACASITTVVSIIVLYFCGVFAHSHKFGEWKTIKEPTCSTYGVKERTCKCGEKETKSIYGSVEHSFCEWYVANEPTCSSDGVEERKCACGKKESRSVFSFVEHSFGEWSIIKEATCGKAGKEQRVCNYCQTIETKVIPANEITFGEWYVDKAPTCTEYGVEKRVCACGTYTGTRTIPATGHSYTDWYIVENATCTTDGREERKCACGSIETKAIPKIDHSYSNWYVVEASTCTTDGREERSCVCGAKQQKTISATGHTDGEWIIDSEATCTENGSKHQKCSVCNNVIKNETIYSSGHNYSKDISPATESSKAKVYFECIECQDSYTQEYGPIVVYAELTGSGIIISSGTYYTRSFEVTATGGFGQYKYKFAAGTNVLQDYSYYDSITVQGNALIDLATITITVMDEAGQKTVYKIKGNGQFVETYVIYD